MDRILLLIEDKEHRSILAACLAGEHDVFALELDAAGVAGQSFDLCIADTASLASLGEELALRKQAEQPAFLPVALVWPRAEVGQVGAALRPVVDELILTPVEEVVLRMRVSTLLRARRLSLDLKQRNEDLQSFIHAMTHDLRAPLTAVMGFSSILVEAQALDDESRRYAQSIHSAGRQMGELIGALVEFSRLGREEIPLGPVPLQPLVYNCLQMLRQQILARGAAVEVQEDLPAVRGNQALLQMTLINLLSNALKYVPQDREPRVSVSATGMAGGYRIEVRDNGIGISAENQQRLFTPFVRLKNKEQYPGLGLGLATVRKALEIMGGRVGIASAPGKGSTFWFELPAPGKQPQAGDQPEGSS